MLENAGLTRIVTVDVHNLGAYENAFSRSQTVHLEAAPLFCEHLQGLDRIGGPLVVLSPDFGGVQRADHFRSRLERVLRREVGFSFLEKIRRHGSIGGHAVAEGVRNAEVLIFDDMISTGETIQRALDACERGGARHVSVLATHGIFSRNADAILATPLLRELIITDTNASMIPPRDEGRERLTVLSCAPMLGRCLETILGTGEKVKVA